MGLAFADELFDAQFTRALAYARYGGAELLVHDVTDPMAFLAMAREYTLRGRESMIRCPTLVCATEGDDLSARAKTLADKLVCPHEYASFGPADDVSGHGEMTGRGTYHAGVFAWLDSVLGKSPQ